MSRSSREAVVLNACVWPPESVGELAEALARHSGLTTSEREQTSTVAAHADVPSACAALGLETEPITLLGGDLVRTLHEAPPAILALTGEGFLGLLEVRRRAIRVLDPSMRTRVIPLDALRSRLCLEATARHSGEIDRLLDICRVDRRDRNAARAALVDDRVRQTTVGHAWQLRVSPGSGFTAQARQAGLMSRLGVFTAAHGLAFVLWLLAWWLLGQAALAGRPDRGWLIAWALLLVTMTPVHMLTMWMQGQLAIGVGGLLKQRLLLGALRLKPDDVRRHGSGQLLGNVIESETVESLALGGGLGAVQGGVELILAAVVLAAGAGGALHVVLLAGWLALTCAAAWQYGRRRLAWTEHRLHMTDDLVERMAGHRTRVAQESPTAWHADEDRALGTYLHRSRAMDTWSAALVGVIPRGWLVVGLAALAPAFVDATGPAAASLAIGLGGVLLGHRAMKKLCTSVAQLSGAAISWRAVKPLFDAAAGDERPCAPVKGSDTGAVAALDVDDVSFRYGDAGDPVLHRIRLRVQRGDRVLLEGGSGGGKSTLAAILAGLRAPVSGMLLAGGIDRHTLGSLGWRQRVAAAPQYHENHVLSASLAFNLLMGRHWPPTPADLEEAEQVCRELGLADLLARMPGGLEQMVGDTGWQLSHGERSRVFMARALLQRAEVVILDESFAALDPANLRQALECVLRRAKTLVVVAHP